MIAPAFFKSVNLASVSCFQGNGLPTSECNSHTHPLTLPLITMRGGEVTRSSQVIFWFHSLFPPHPHLLLLKTPASATSCIPPHTISIELLFTKSVTAIVICVTDTLRVILVWSGRERLCKCANASFPKMSFGEEHPFKVSA